MKIPSALASVLCACVLAGCSDETQVIETRCVPKCEGETRVTCGTDDSEVRINCAEQALHCAVATGPTAICAESAERLPSCNKRTSVCEGNWVTTCYDGYPMDRVDCDFANRVCFGGASEAACVVSATPEPKCAGAENTWLCGDDLAILCFEGRAAARHDCVGCKVSADDLIDANGKSCI